MNTFSTQKKSLAKFFFVSITALFCLACRNTPSNEELYDKALETLNHKKQYEVTAEIEIALQADGAESGDFMKMTTTAQVEEIREDEIQAELQLDLSVMGVSTQLDYHYTNDILSVDFMGENISQNVTDERIKDLLSITPMLSSEDLASLSSEATQDGTRLSYVVDIDKVNPTDFVNQFMAFLEIAASENFLEGLPVSVNKIEGQILLDPNGQMIENTWDIVIQTSDNGQEILLEIQKKIDYTYSVAE